MATCRDLNNAVYLGKASCRNNDSLHVIKKFVIILSCVKTRVGALTLKGPCISQSCLTEEILKPSKLK